MEVRDEDKIAWEQQLQELREGDELSQKFLKFIVFWSNAVEAELKKQTESSVGWCIRRGFVSAEEAMGPVPSIVATQGLCLFLSYWVHRDELFEQLTPFEQKYVLEVLAEKIDQKQREAEEGLDSEQAY